MRPTFTPRTALLMALVTAPFAGAAQANCPTADMLEGDGILFTQDNGDYEIHERAPNGTILQTFVYEDGKNLVYITHGVYVQQLSSLEDGRILPDSLVLYDFGVPNDALPAPVAGGTWSAEVTRYSASIESRETVRQEWGELTRFTIGDCTLDAIPVSSTIDGSDFEYKEEIMYFPDLGTGLWVGFTENDVTEKYTYVDVREN